MTNAYEIRAARLAAEYAQNRIDISVLTKAINVLTDWQRPDKGVSLDEIRTEFLEDGDRWRGWMYAIDHVRGNRDEDDEPATAEQLELASLLDQKAALRVAAGKIKRSIVMVGRQLLKAGP